jgi:hypothetical protein
MTTPNPTVLVMPPYTSPRSGRRIGWSRSHAPGCPKVQANETWWRNQGYDVTFSRMRASQVPAEVGRCSVCGGGR